MSNISKSPHRYRQQMERYVERQQKEGKRIDTNLIDWMQKVIKDHESKFDSNESRQNNLEYDLRTTDWILNKVREKDTYAQNLYAAMCNNSFQKLEVIPILKGLEFSCSWRYAGGIIADMRGHGDYIDWYCSGIRDDYDANNDGRNYVPESVVTEEIQEDLRQLGWILIDDDEEH